MPQMKPTTTETRFSAQAHGAPIRSSGYVVPDFEPCLGRVAFSQNDNSRPNPTPRLLDADEKPELVMLPSTSGSPIPVLRLDRLSGSPLRGPKRPEARPAPNPVSADDAIWCSEPERLRAFTGNVQHGIHQTGCRLKCLGSRTHEWSVSGTRAASGDSRSRTSCSLGLVPRNLIARKGTMVMVSAILNFVPAILNFRCCHFELRSCHFELDVAILNECPFQPRKPRRVSVYNHTRAG